MAEETTGLAKTNGVAAAPAASNKWARMFLALKGVADNDPRLAAAIQVFGEELQAFGKDDKRVMRALPHIMKALQQLQGD